MATPRVTIFNKNGYRIGDIRCHPVYEFILNAKPSPGKCTFTIGRHDPKASLKYLEFGNYVLIRHYDLPDWIGEIAIRSWNNGSVEITAFQIEYVLGKRNTNILKYTGTAGSIFIQALQYTNGLVYNEKKITPYNIDVSGVQREETFGNNALSHISAVSDRSGNDFDVSYVFDVNGKLNLVGNWYPVKGIVTREYLREAHNIEALDGVLIEDARDFANYIEGRGDASTGSTRLSSVIYNERSINQYGLNQISTVFDGNTQQATLDSNTLNLLFSILDPACSYDLTGLNVRNAFGFSLFRYLNVGNVLNIDLNTVGFAPNGGFGLTNVMVRILGMSYDALEDKCRLIVEKYTPLLA